MTFPSAVSAGYLYAVDECLSAETSCFLFMDECSSVELSLLELLLEVLDVGAFALSGSSSEPGKSILAAMDVGVPEKKFKSFCSKLQGFWRFLLLQAAS